ncbi:helix-turn-helix transcriptional regulator [Thermoleptolyngbya oregonensis NK1-22]|uniref:Helix-turn-helix transcriptional regulator n=1 Tax=Thermoleptolyngbya oregonensis NK1-22 TaxID=2547457 RepID=A0AA97B9P6_9CYAN|nr:helix-turn-helix transcriptional regulator [Thermoleptolyngbya oregonensis]WOB42985.1 helix-turn-helix transcriptional regulator [Thermoleptolyngbya oregonensis NK1-22]
MSNENVITSPLVELRERAGLTQESLAQLLGVTDHTVRNWEKGRAEAKLTLKQFKALCAALKVSADELPDSFSPNDGAAN